MPESGRPAPESPGEAYWLLGVINKRKGSVLLVWLIVSLGGVVFYLTAPRQYESRFEIALKQEAIPESLQALRQMAAVRTESVKDHMHLIKSSEVLKKALQRGSLVRDGDAEASVQQKVEHLRTQMTVRSKEEGAHYIEVLVRAEDPFSARQLADYILAAYRVMEETNRKGAFQDNLEMSRRKEEEIRKEMETCREALEAFDDIAKDEAEIARLAGEEQAAFRRMQELRGKLEERKNRLTPHFNDMWYEVRQINDAMRAMDFALANYDRPLGHAAPGPLAPPAAPLPSEAPPPALLPPADLGLAAPLPPADMDLAVPLPPADVNGAVHKTPDGTNGVAHQSPADANGAAPQPPADPDGAASLALVLADQELNAWNIALQAARTRLMERKRIIETRWDRKYLAVWRRYGKLASRSDVEKRLEDRQQNLANVEQDTRRIQTSIKESISPVSVTEVPTLPRDQQISPQPIKIALLTAIVALILAPLVVYFQEMAAPSLQSVDQVSHFTGKHVLGAIPYMNTNMPNSTAPPDEYPALAFLPEGRVRLYSESYRILKTNIMFALPHTASPAILLTSSYPSEGKSTVCANLGLAFAEEGNRTVILECNLRRPSMAIKFNLPSLPGMTDILEKDADWRNLVCQTFMPNLSLIQMGRLSDKSSTILNRDAFKRLIDSLKKRFNIILVDSPPSLLVADAALLSTHVDGVVLVYALGLTPKNELKRAVELFKRVKNNLLGVVTNGRQPGLFYQRTKHYYYTPEKKKKLLERGRPGAV
jgi:capsular exopolysaccharide synthesis family protein